MDRGSWYNDDRVVGLFQAGLFCIHVRVRNRNTESEGAMTSLACIMLFRKRSEILFVSNELHALPAFMIQ